MRDFEAYLKQKQVQYEGLFSDSELNKDFIPYYNNQKRIEVDFGYDKKRGTIGITTGWKPCFILLLTKRSIGSSWTIDKNCKILKEIK